MSFHGHRVPERKPIQASSTGYYLWGKHPKLENKLENTQTCIPDTCIDTQHIQQINSAKSDLEMLLYGYLH